MKMDMPSRSRKLKECVGLCTDGAPSMIGSIKRFVSLVKKS